MTDRGRRDEQDELSLGVLFPDAAHPGYAGFVISTLPAEKSRWLRMDLPRTVRAKHGLPVHHVVADLEFSLADLP